jgi:hypothetical protein
MRVWGECYGLWRRGFEELKESVLSLEADSLWESVPVIWVEVRDWFLINLKNQWVTCGLIERVFVWHWIAKETAPRRCGGW